MLGLPPAFVLSQDQTLQFDLLVSRDVPQNVFTVVLISRDVPRNVFTCWLALLLQSFDCVCVSFSSSVFISAIGAFAPSARGGLYACAREVSRIILCFFSGGIKDAPGYDYGAFQARR